MTSLIRLRAPFHQLPLLKIQSKNYRRWSATDALVMAQWRQAAYCWLGVSWPPVLFAANKMITVSLSLLHGKVCWWGPSQTVQCERALVFHSSALFLSHTCKTHTQTHSQLWESIAVVCGYNLSAVPFTNLTRSFQHNIDWHHSTLHTIIIPLSTSPLERIHWPNLCVFISSIHNSFILQVHVLSQTVLSCDIYVSWYSWLNRMSISKDVFVHVMSLFWVLWPAVKPS